MWRNVGYGGIVNLTRRSRFGRLLGRRYGRYSGAALVVGIAAAVIVAILVQQRGGDERPPAATERPPSATAVPAAIASIPDCPVDREICDFAVQAEGWVRTGDAASIVRGSDHDTANGTATLRRSIESTLPVIARRPRIASIGCPLLNGAGDCSGAFSLTFTTLTPMERDYSGRILILGFKRSSGGMPVLTGISSAPGAEDRIFARVNGGRSIGCGLSGMTPRTETECIQTEFSMVTVDRPQVPGQPPECPLLPAICALALDVETQLAAGDFAAVAGSAEAGAELKADLQASLGGGAPRLIGIACPFGPLLVHCDGSFAIAFTTLDPAANCTTGGRMVVLRYGDDGSATRAAFADILALDGGDTRAAAIRGGFASSPCNIAGQERDRPDSCGGAVFERYWSSAAFVPDSGPTPLKLTRRAPSPLPANAVLFTAHGPCWACDAADESMQRHSTDVAGTMTTTTILENSKGILAGGWLIGQLTGSADGAVLAAMVCDGRYCGPLGSTKPIATWRVVWSKDGGVSWTEGFRLETEYAGISSVTRDGFVVVSYRSNPGGAIQTTYAVRGTETRELRMPADLPPRPNVALLADGSVVWIPLSVDGLVVGELRREDGSALGLDLPAGAQYPTIGSFADGRIWAAWSGGMVGLFKISGEVEALYSLSDISFRTLASPTLGIGTVSATGVDGGIPAIIDLAARTETPLGPPFGQAPLNGRNRAIAIQAGR